MCVVRYPRCRSSVPCFFAQSCSAECDISFSRIECSNRGLGGRCAVHASLAIIDAADSAVSDISGISTVDTKSVGFGAAGTTFSTLPQGTFVAVLVDGAGGVLAITRAFDVSCSGEIDDSDYHLE